MRKIKYIKRSIFLLSLIILTIFAQEIKNSSSSGGGTSGGSGSGTVNSGTTGQIAFYPVDGTAVSGESIQTILLAILTTNQDILFRSGGTVTRLPFVGNGNCIGGVSGSYAAVACGGGGSGVLTPTFTGIAKANTSNTLTLATASDLPLTYSGNTTKVTTMSGSVATGNVPIMDASGNLSESGHPALLTQISSPPGTPWVALMSGGANVAGASLAVSGNGPTLMSGTGTFPTGHYAGFNGGSDIIDIGIGVNTPAFTGLAKVTNASATISQATLSDIISAIGSISANVGFFGPVSGGAAVPAFRALVVADLPFTYTGTGTKLATATGSFISGNCVHTDASHNFVDDGTACGGSGSLPSQTGNAGLYLTTNGTVASWTNIITGGSGGLDCATTPGVCDVVSAVVGFIANANTWTGVQKFNKLQLTPTSTAPACAISGDIGNVWLDNTSSVTTHLKVCSAVSSSPAFVTVY